MSDGDTKKATDEVAAEIRAIAAMREEDIDTSDIPEIRDWSGAVRGPFWEKRQPMVPVPIDADVFAWFQSQGEDHREAMNLVLRRHAFGRSTPARRARSGALAVERSR